MATEQRIAPVGDPRFVEVTNWKAVREAFGSRSLTAANVGGIHDQHFNNGTMLRLDGKEHTHRRRAASALLAHRGHQWFRDNTLYPTVRRNLDALLAEPDEDGVSRVDLVPFAYRNMIQLASAVAGIDAAKTAEGAEELHDLIEAFAKGETFLESLYGFDVERIMPRALAAKERYREHFFLPSLERRQELVRRVEAGELDESELPHDVITLHARRPGEIWDDETALPETILVMTGGTDTSAYTLTWAIHELFAYFEQHPEDWERRTDVTFLLPAVTETLRLHPALFAFLRRAIEDVTLSDGTEITAGQLVVLRTGSAGRDPEAYGDDADEFNPYREIGPRVYPYGLAFGSGPHMCFGLPVVLGSEGIDGSLVHILQKLFEAGVRPDPDRPPQKYGAERHGDQFASYPVLFRPETAP
jgi:cytochrome P450